MWFSCHARGAPRRRIKINELTKYLKTHENIIQDCSVLIFNLANKKKSIEKNLIEKWINTAIKNGKKNMITGKELTPYLIKEINALSNNQTLETNMELIMTKQELQSPKTL